MKYLIVLVVLCIGIPKTAMAWSFGGLDVKEMKDIQEKAYQAGLACQRGDHLDSCDNFVAAFRQEVDLYKKNEKEIGEGGAKGDPDCERIILNGKIIFELAESLRKRRT